jgi:hypothetical protein
MIAKSSANVGGHAGLKAWPLTPPPGHGSLWRGISHYELVQRIKRELTSVRIEPTGEWFFVSPDGQDMAGGLVIPFLGKNEQGKPVLPPSPGFAFGLGIATSNARRRALNGYSGIFFMGGKWRTPTPLLMHRFRVARRPSMTNEDVAHTFVQKWRKGLDSQHRATLTRLDRRRISIADREHLIIRAGENSLMSWSRLGRVHEKARGGSVQTYLDFIMGFAEVCAMSPPLLQQDNLYRFYELCRNHTHRSEK